MNESIRPKILWWVSRAPKTKAYGKTLYSSKHYTLGGVVTICGLSPFDGAQAKKHFLALEDDEDIDCQRCLQLWNDFINKE
jgi:hypothetical protein